MSTFKYGDVVEVVDVNKYREVHVGAIGTVRSAYDNQIAVVFDDIHNPRSAYDCFYFKANQLKYYKGDKIMEGNYSIATVRFMDGSNTDKTYRYALYDDNVGVGDICVVKSAHHGFGIAGIVDIEPKTDEKIIREVVCKCDFGRYLAREAARKRREELMRKMAARAAQLQEIALYKMMAAEDASMAELLNELDGLGDY